MLVTAGIAGVVGTIHGGLILLGMVRVGASAEVGAIGMPVGIARGTGLGIIPGTIRGMARLGAGAEVTGLTITTIIMRHLIPNIIMDVRQVDVIMPDPATVTVDVRPVAEVMLVADHPLHCGEVVREDVYRRAIGIPLILAVNIRELEEELL